MEEKPPSKGKAGNLKLFNNLLYVLALIFSIPQNLIGLIQVLKQLGSEHKTSVVLLTAE